MLEIFYIKRKPKHCLIRNKQDHLKENKNKKRDISQKGFRGGACSSLVIRERRIVDRVRKCGSGHLRACF